MTCMVAWFAWLIYHIYLFIYFILFLLLSITYFFIYLFIFLLYCYLLIYLLLSYHFFLNLYPFIWLNNLMLLRWYAWIDFWKFKKDFSGVWDIEFEERRTPQVGRLPIAIKNTGWWFWVGRKRGFQKKTFRRRSQKRGRRKEIDRPTFSWGVSFSL